MINMNTKAMRKSYVIIDVGGSFLKSAVLDEDGFVHVPSYFTVKSHAESDMKEQIIQAFEESIAHGLTFIGDNELETGGIGIAIPGPFNYRDGISLMTHKFQSLYNLNLKDMIAEATGIHPDLPVTFVHDVNAVLMGELWTGNAKDYANAAVACIGTGLGFAHLQNRIVQCNEYGSPLISIFKTPCRQSILEDYVSKRGILKIYGEMAGNEIANTMKVIDIAKLADEGDGSALATFREAGSILSEVLADILTEKNIECLLFAGQISRSFHHFETAIREGLKDVGSLKRIGPVSNIDYAAFYGVLWKIRYFNNINFNYSPFKSSKNHDV